MRIDISHEIDAPLDVLSLAVLSPEVGPMLARALAPAVESVQTTRHELANGVLHRVLHYQASAPLAIFSGLTVARDALTWDATFVYTLATHEAAWEVAPKEQYRRYFQARGTYRLEALPDGRTRRTVSGDIEIGVPVPVLRGLVERIALTEVRKSYDAEAETLRKLATL